jgi:hypothetical protein
MTVQERHGISGRLSILVRSPGGEWREVRSIHNLITRSGKEFLAKVFTGALQGHVLHVAVGGGDDDKAPTAEDTKLKHPHDQVRAAFDGPELRSVDGEDRVVVKVAANLPSLKNAETQILSEAGIVVVVPGQPDAVLYNRVKFDPISRSGSLEMKLTWEIMF